MRIILRLTIFHVLPLLMELQHSHQAHHWFKRYAFTSNSLEPFRQPLCLVDVKAFHLDISGFSKYKKATDYIFGDRISDGINYHRARFSCFAFLEKLANHNKP